MRAVPAYVRWTCPAFAWLFLLLFAGVVPQRLQGQILSDSSFQFSAYLELYYQFDFNRPSSGRRPDFIYNFHRNEDVNINLGYLKAAYATDRIRASLALMAGTYAEANLAAEPDLLQMLYEANAGFRLSKKTKLWLDAGVMPSHLGYETARGMDNPTLTRSLRAENSPYYETGLRVSYETRNEKWYIAAFYLNGWQRIRRPPGNTSPAGGVQISYSPVDGTTLNYSSFLGNDQPDSARRFRHFHDLYGIFQLSERVNLRAGIDLGWEQQSKGSGKMNSWYGIDAIFRYAFNSRLSLAGRIEYFSDPSGVIIQPVNGFGIQTLGYSIGADYLIHKRIVWRAEFRSFQSSDPIYDNKSGQFRQNSPSVASSICVMLD